MIELRKKPNNNRETTHLSRQVWGKAANPLHIFQQFQLCPFRRVFLLSLSPIPCCFLRLLFCTWRVLCGHPLGFGPTANQSDWNVHSSVSAVEEGRDLASERLFEVYIHRHAAADPEHGPVLQ